MIYRFENFTLDPSGHSLKLSGQDCDVEPQVFDLITLLVKNHGKLISKDTIIDEIWDGKFISESSISTRINSARSALNDNGKSQRLIKTIHNKGYKFVGKVNAVAPDDDLNPPNAADIKVLPVKSLYSFKAAGFIVAAVIGTAAILSVTFVAFSGLTSPASQFSEKPNIDSAAENAARGYSLNPNRIPKGKANNFVISEYSIGDTLDGKKGVDTLDLSNYTDGGFFVGLFAGKARDLRFEEGDGEYNVINIENIIGTPQDDIFRGSIFPNIIRGGAGNDQLFSYGDRDFIYGGPGNDYINGGYDIDIIDAGPGDDRILVATVSRGDHVDGGPGMDTFDLSKFTASPYHVDLSNRTSRELSDRGIDIYKLENVENVVGTALNDIIIGDEKDNVLTGSGGDDDLNGGIGQDTAVFRGQHDNYIFEILADKKLTITDKFGYDGIDTLNNIEAFKFSDTTLTLSIIEAEFKKDIAKPQ